MAARHEAYLRAEIESLRTELRRSQDHIREVTSRLDRFEKQTSGGLFGALRAALRRRE